MNYYLYPKKDLPKDFLYPSSFINLVMQIPLINIEPWWFLCEYKEFAEYWLVEIKKQYPHRKLVPFAKISDSDDIACFDGSAKTDDPKVYHIHAFASLGWEDRGCVNNFSEWLDLAKKESILYKSHRNED